MNENQISIYKEIIATITANKNYSLNQISRHKENIKGCNKSIRKYEAKIKELNETK